MKAVLIGLVGIGLLIVIWSILTVMFFKPTSLTFALQVDLYNNLIEIPPENICATPAGGCDELTYYLGRMTIDGQQIALPMTVKVEGSSLSPTKQFTKDVVDGRVAVPVVVTWYNPYTYKGYRVEQTVLLQVDVINRILKASEDATIGVNVYLGNSFGPELEINPQIPPRRTFMEQINNIGSPTGGQGQFNLSRSPILIQELTEEETLPMKTAYLLTQSTPDLVE